MRKLIIISGDLASGKSTLANELSIRHDIIHFTKDKFKESLCDIFSFTNREENRRLSVAAVEIMMQIFSECAIIGNDLILEGNFREEELLVMKNIAEENDYQTCLIFLTGETHLLYERFLCRLTNRHPAHTSLHLEENFEKFAQYLNTFRMQDQIFTPHVIDMSDFSIDEVADFADKILEEEGLFAL